MKPNISRLEGLTDDQLAHLSGLIETLGYRKASGQASKEFDREIPKTSLQRFTHRAAVKDFLDDTAEAQAALGEILRYAATGKPEFAVATLHILEQTAFQLSFACTRTEEDMKALTHIATMLCRFRNATVRERMAAIQERKAELRAEELALKKAEKQKPAIDTQVDELTAKLHTAFSLHPVLSAFVATPNPLRSEPDFQTPTAPPSPESPLSKTLSEASSPSTNEPPALPNRPASRTTDTPEPIPCVLSSPQCQIENAQCSMLNETVPPTCSSDFMRNEEVPSVPSVPPLEPLLSSLSENPQSAIRIPQSLEHRVNQYTLDRYHEALRGKDPTQVGRFAAWSFKSQMQWCPCGKDLPCRQHGDFPNYFWELISDDPDYALLLRKKNLPYTAPNLLLREQEKTAKRLVAAKSAIHAPTASSPHSAIVAHALRRWASYTPRPPGTPPPDDSWINECPCGAKLPCDHHDDLWREVRYLRPTDPDYAAALARHKIPFHRPPDEDLQPPPSPPSSEILSETPSETPSSVPQCLRGENEK